MPEYGFLPVTLVTDDLRSYQAAGAILALRICNSYAPNMIFFYF